VPIALTGPTMGTRPLTTARIGAYRSA
jgi:hypothetical protein